MNGTNDCNNCGQPREVDTPSCGYDYDECSKDGLYVYWKPIKPRFPMEGAEPSTDQSVDNAKKALDVQEGGNHYKKYKIQPIEFCYANNIPAIEASVIKYAIRHRDKNGVEDINKAIHLLNILKDLEYGS